MENTGIRPEVIEEIRKLAEKYNISRVILFGSRARGDFKRASDIDLAVEGGDFARFALDVDEETSTLLKYDIVDMGRNIQEELWLNALRERNNVVHSYNRNIALEIVSMAKEKFYDMFCELDKEIKNNWIEEETS